MKSDILNINMRFSGPEDEDESDNDVHDTSSDLDAAEEQENLGDSGDTGGAEQGKS